jgi:hypothetical protein
LAKIIFLGEGIQVSSIDVDPPSPSGCDTERVQNTKKKKKLKSSSPKQLGQFQSNLIHTIIG